MTLDEARSGEKVRVLAVPPGLARIQMLRLGIGEGSELLCVLKIPAGPMVLRQGNLEVALGRKTASGITVVRCCDA